MGLLRIVGHGTGQALIAGLQHRIVEIIPARDRLTALHRRQIGHHRQDVGLQIGLIGQPAQNHPFAHRQAGHLGPIGQTGTGGAIAIINRLTRARPRTRTHLNFN
tara:strand:+ start:7037 stop:7351 length:315 start_codon:yes stop_codon:yes gene_type:complete